MATTVTTLTTASDWQQIIAAGNDFGVQVIGQWPVYFQAASSLPATGTLGLLRGPGEGFTQADLPNGNIYARPAIGNRPSAVAVAT